MAGLMVLIKTSAGAQSAGNLTRRGLKLPEFLIVDGAAVCVPKIHTRR
ncbi:MAG: hypothetical protein JO283_03335 [Bradyrhizobium sp.]|nr:hypothetical protein [Bradyrhizobium sp.]